MTLIDLVDWSCELGCLIVVFQQIVVYLMNDESLIPMPDRTNLQEVDNCEGDKRQHRWMKDQTLVR